MNGMFEDYIELRGFIEKNFGNLIKETHGKDFHCVKRDFSKKCHEAWKTWPRPFGGGIFQIRVYSTKGIEYVIILFTGIDLSISGALCSPSTNSAFSTS